MVVDNDKMPCALSDKSVCQQTIMEHYTIPLMEMNISMYTNTNPLDFYRKQGVMSDPRRHSSLFSNLPDDIPALCKVVQGLLVHEGWAGQYGVSMSEERTLESSIRMVSKKVDHILELNNQPLIEPRPAQQRLFSICRDFALLLTTMLRYKGIPARVRFGFANYFFPPNSDSGYGDHVITEYWNAQDQRWVLVDAQLDELQCEAVQISFDPCDVPRDVFLTGDIAWQRCQNEGADPKKFGFLPGYTGLWYVKGHLARDIAALNKIEMLCWDYWGIFERRDVDLPDDLKLLDHAAKLSISGNENFVELRSLYLQDMRLRVAPVVKSWYVENEEEYRLEEIFGRDLSLVKYL